MSAAVDVWSKGVTHVFGTVAHVRVKPGMEQEFQAIGEQWVRERGEPSGQIAEYVFKLEKGSNEYILIGIFPDREEYFKNAEDPETDRWYRRMREVLAADPEWNDGEVIQAVVFSGVM